jgi:uncharacterized membrane protein YphA (DoxX/SURF4 family)
MAQASQFRTEATTEERADENIKQTVAWFNERRELALDVVRIYLGLGLLAKGIYFIADDAFISSALLDGGGLELIPAAVSHLIPIVHILGGALLAVGFLTRFAALIQLPILVGAVFVVHLPEGLFTRGQTLEFTLLVTFLLCLFAAWGSGSLSIDARSKSRS